MEDWLTAVAGKVRVHELAKELGVRGKDLLAHLKAEGEFVKSASSVVNAPVARRVREFYRNKGADPAVSASDVGPPTIANLVNGGTTVADLISELGVSDAAVMGYLRHLGAEVRNPNSVTTPQFADQVRKRFDSSRDHGSPGIQRDAQSASKVNGRDHRPESMKSAPEPKYAYVYEPATDVVHHRDYLNGYPDQTLCGSQNVKVRLSPIVVVPHEVCPDCLAKLPEYHAKWWSDQFKSLSDELMRLRADYQRLQARSDDQRKQISRLQKKADGTKEASRQGKPHSQTPKRNSQQQRRNSQQQRNSGRPSAKVSKRPPRSTPVPVKREPPRAPDPEVVRRRVREMMAPPRPRTEAEKRSDEAARESMRSHKPSSWRRGRSPSSYG